MSVFYIELTTKERLTVECDSYADAEAKAAWFVNERTLQHGSDKVTTSAVIDPNAQKDCYYFGCLDQTGHYLHGIPHGMSYYKHDLPWKELDGKLLANAGEPDRVTGYVRSTVGKSGERWWWAFVWWDRSVDQRGGSNSGFYVSGFGPNDREAAFEFAKERWRRVVTRQTIPLRLVP